jgi:CubicO group peptidase (beta-lactamase class C family)
MAALSAYSLVRERRFSLNTPVRSFLPWFEFADGTGGDVTFRHLISHTTGLTDLSFDDLHPTASGLEAAVRCMGTARPSAPPGRTFHYIDTDYQALGLAMESATGKPYAAILSERIFSPLGMKSSSAAQPIISPVGSASFFALPLPRPAISSSFGAPSGYVVTTAADAAQYLAFLLGPEKFGRGPLSPRSVPSLFQAPVPGAPYGFGFFLGSEAGERSAYHDGSFDGFSSRVVLWPDRRAGIAVIAAQGSLLQSLFALPAMTSGARRIMLEGSAPRLFPLGRLYILLAVAAVVSILGQVFQIGAALHWAKEVRDRAEAKGSRGPILLAVARCWAGLALRALFVALCPIIVSLAFQRATSWKILLQLEPGLAAWYLIICALGLLRNAARLAWMRGPAGFLRSK